MNKLKYMRHFIAENQNTQWYMLEVEMQQKEMLNLIGEMYEMMQNLFAQNA